MSHGNESLTPYDTSLLMALMHLFLPDSKQPQTGFHHFLGFGETALLVLMGTLDGFERNATIPPVSTIFPV